MSRCADRMAGITGAERYLKHRREDPEYDRAYVSARPRIDQIDTIIRALDERRCCLKLTKAELARRAGLRPEVIRRLFSTESPNPTLSTIVALAGALEMELTAEPLEEVGAS
ncbi:MAG: helix-turn-helix domain-containing protein [Acidimicrobiaceae bacterium]|nr:helix-turn-helix domain-containing protein [Acidimicrobiaceae bacterium]MYJ42110.1 helix-turn-helix domain-containing protein [Acidimicrobiaceae bacterium]